MVLDNLRFWKPSRALFAGAAMTLAAACGGKEGCDPTGPCADTQNPQISVSANSATNPTMFSANATDDKGIKSVRFKVDGADYGALDTSAPYEAPVTGLAAGQHTLTAIATDIFDKTATSAPQNFTIAAAPVAQDITLAFKEGQTASIDLATKTTGDANRTYELLNVPATIDASIASGTLTAKGKANGSTAWDDVNGTHTFQYITTNPATGIKDTASVVADIAAQSRVRYELREARSDTLIKTAATLQLVKQGTSTIIDVPAANGVFDRKVDPGTYDVILVNNADTFKSDRVLSASGALEGINWEGNDRITVNYQNDMNGAGRIERLAKQGSPYGSLTEMMRIYDLVWGPQHTAPTFPEATIRILNGANSSYGCTRAPTASELDIIAQGALDTKAQYETTDYKIKIDTVNAVSSTPATHPEGVQLVCIGEISSNGIFRAPNEKIIGSIATLRTNFNRVVVRDELYEMHAGQSNEDPQNGNTFFGSNRAAGITDLTAGDKDIEIYVNRLYARDAEKKRTAAGANATAYILKQ